MHVVDRDGLLSPLAAVDDLLARGEHAPLQQDAFVPPCKRELLHGVRQEVVEAGAVRRGGVILGAERVVVVVDAAAAVAAARATFAQD
jgi:hypothetical protein